EPRPAAPRRTFSRNVPSVFGPILRGTRVTLRPPRKEDLETYLAWFADPEVTRYQPRSTPFSPAQEEAWFTRTGEDPNSVVWAIEVDGKAVGTTGIGQIDWLHRHGTTGITIGEKSLWRQGLASEAMRSEEHTSELQSPDHLV